MSETEESQAEEGASVGFLALLREWDWLKIPGAARALAHLVTGTADAAVAWTDVAKAKGEQRAQQIRDRNPEPPAGGFDAASGHGAGDAAQAGDVARLYLLDACRLLFEPIDGKTK
jgi:hypothetical protein